MERYDIFVMEVYPDKPKKGNIENVFTNSINMSNIEMSTQKVLLCILVYMYLMPKYT